jgi:2-phosphosulfolactate phosphatase
MVKSFAVDCFVDEADHYRYDYAIVAVDVIRATTTAVTAVSMGRACFPVPSLEVATTRAAELENPLLVGELGGNMPYGFDLTNSPAALAARTDISRPMVLLSSSGTRLLCAADGASAVYAACLRNYAATARHLSANHKKVALLGAGTRGEFREEDQMCCAWMGQELLDLGYIAENEATMSIVERWKGAHPSAFMVSKSVDYLRRSEQLEDLEFILKHIDDLDSAFVLEGDHIVEERLARKLAVALGPLPVTAGL